MCEAVRLSVSAQYPSYNLQHEEEGKEEKSRSHLEKLIKLLQNPQSIQNDLETSFFAALMQKFCFVM